MEKRFLLAVGLSLLVLIMYSSMMPHTQPAANQCVITNLKPQQERSAQTIPAVPQEAKPGLKIHNILEKNNLYTLEGDDLTLEFSKIGGFIVKAIDKAHSSLIPITNIGLVEEWSGYVFNVSKPLNGENGVVFDYSGNGSYGIKKTYTIKPNGIIDLNIEIYNITSSKFTGYNIFAGYFNPKDVKDQLSQRYYESSVFVNDIIQRKPVFGLKKAIDYDGNINWVGLRDRYFCGIILPHLSVNKAVVNFIEDGVCAKLYIPERSLTSNSPAIIDNYSIYLGPQDSQRIKNLGSNAQEIVYFGNFNSISKGLLFVLSGLHKITKNWGLAIIAISVLIYLVLFPLSYKSMLSMRKMQVLQPKIEEIRAKYKDSPQKLNIEIMELYKREKANPFGGCLPMILQIPVFFALYQLLMRFISLKCAPFLWIKDLSEPDRLVIFKNPIPLMGADLNILPILMGAIMFVQQKIASPPAAASSQMAEQQKIMTVVMPVLFCVLFYKLSSGLVLYWFVNSILMFIFQWKISKIKI